MFCSTWQVCTLLPIPFTLVLLTLSILWQDFCYIINGYCNGRAGVNFVKHGDFELIRPEDNRTISPSNFVSAAQPGMVFEMSIVLGQILDTQGNYNTTVTTCPRCHRVSNAGVSFNKWIEW